MGRVPVLQWGPTTELSFLFIYTLLLTLFRTRMQFLVVFILVAVLLHIGDASELVDSKAEIQKAQQMVDERHEALINVITEHFPDLNKEAMHERRLVGTYTSYL